MSELNKTLSHQKKPSYFILRLFLWLIGLLIILAIVIPIAFVAFFDPNDYKKELTSYIQEKTHLPIAINGPIKFHYFPWIGLAANDVTDGDVFTAKSIEFIIPLRDLLQGKCIIETLTLEEPTFHLIQKADGSTNWSPMVAAVKNLSETSKNAHKNLKKDNRDNTDTSHENDVNAFSSKLAFSLSELTVKNATIHYDDQQNKRSIIIQKMELDAIPTDSLKDFKISMKGVLEYQSQDPLLNMNGPIQSHGTLHLDKDFHVNQILSATLKIPNAPKDWQSITFDTKLTAEPSHVLLSNLDLKSASHVTGSIHIPLNSDNKKNQPIKADLNIDQLTVQSQRLTDIHALILKDGSFLSLKPLSANFYDGKLLAELTKNLNNPKASIAINGYISDFNLSALLQNLKKDVPFSGKTTLDFKLHYNPTAPIEGTVKCKITDGAIKGVDVNYYLKMAGALLKAEPSSGTRNTKLTRFDTLTAILKLHDNSIDNNDLVITSNDFIANGEGSVYLTPQTIEYKLKAQRIYHDGKDHANALPLAIRIKGKLSDPSVMPDFDVYLKSKIKVDIKKDLNKQIQKQLDKHLQKYFTPESTNTESTNHEDSTQPVDPLQEAVEKNIKKGLKKLFKK